MCHLFIVFLLRIFNSLREKNTYTLPKEKAIGNTLIREKKNPQKVNAFSKNIPISTFLCGSSVPYTCKNLQFLSNLHTADMKFNSWVAMGKERMADS